MIRVHTHELEERMVRREIDREVVRTQHTKPKLTPDEIRAINVRAREHMQQMGRDAMNELERKQKEARQEAPESVYILVNNNGEPAYRSPGTDGQTAHWLCSEANKYPSQDVTIYPLRVVKYVLAKEGE